MESGKAKKLSDDIFFYIFAGTIALGFLAGLGYLVYAYLTI
jgi:hypothetical protein